MGGWWFNEHNNICLFFYLDEKKKKKRLFTFMQTEQIHTDWFTDVCSVSLRLLSFSTAAN